MPPFQTTREGERAHQVGEGGPRVGVERGANGPDEAEDVHGGDHLGDDLAKRDGVRAGPKTAVTLGVKALWSRRTLGYRNRLSR